MDPYAIILKPHVTEKTMNLIDYNELVFVVSMKSNKPAIKRAFEELFGEAVLRVNTHISPKGEKLAFIRLTEEGNAEDIAVQLGVF